MNDDVKAAVEWLAARLFGGDEVPAIRALRAHLDAEPARIAAAVAAAREEQREACAAQFFNQRTELVAIIRTTPLDATPLADELERSWQETARMVERAEKAEAEVDALKAQVERARAAVDAAKARIKELEKTLKERDEQSLFEGQREHLWNATFNATAIERAEKVEAERDEAVSALRGLRREVSARLTGRDSEPGEFEKAWQTACAVLAKYKEET